MSSGSEVTVFVISCDTNPNRHACLESLRSQTYDLDETEGELVEIRNVAPMSAAFQQMLTRCKTPFFIQVDEDMVLEDDAIERMVATMVVQPDNVAMVVFMLHDAHLDMPIQGVKIYRHAAMAQHPYDETVISCEKNQLDRLLDDGYKIVNRMEVIGEHSPRWTDELIFERYFDLEEKWKLYGYTWLEGLVAKLLAKYLADPSSLNLYAYLGALASRSQTGRLRTREKDYRVRTREFLIAKSLHSQPTQATLYMTSRCNMRCPWCLRQGNMAVAPSAPDMTPGKVDELCVRFPSLTAVCLCGFGETLLHPDVPAIVRQAKKHNLFVNLITNGLGLSEAWHLLLQDRPSTISVSLNASNAQEHEAQSGIAGAWQKIMDGFDVIQSYRTRWKSWYSNDPGIPVVLSRVCTVQNLDGVPEFLQLAKRLGVCHVDLHNILPHDVSTPEKTDAFLKQVLTVDHWKQLDAIRKLPEAYLVSAWPTPIDPEHPVRHCNFPFQAIAMDGNGDISICNSVWPPKPENGNILDPKCWHNDYCTNFRLSFTEPEIHRACRYCFRNYQ